MNSRMLRDKTIGYHFTGSSKAFKVAELKLGVCRVTKTV